ncbi:MAG: efflux RND transporter permease subunit [Saprospiraceae bacterium]|nr:efflux RND transporter permease subunit [Saprospiraceae bacterium]
MPTRIWGSLSVRDGQYRYFIKVATSITNLEAVRNIPVRTQQDYIPLHRICTIGYDQKTKLGYHIYNGEPGLVLTVQKQAQARMNELMPALYEAISHFKTDYPTLRFESSRDQKFLLDAGIDNLRQDIYYGGILTIALLFLFLGHWSAPTLMSISIPLSLVISVIFFYWLDVSFNIISLSGVALGIGMLIDNSIVVIDHISRKRKNGNSLTESAIQGTNEMVVPVVSQVLTTVAVYAPLVLLHGIAGDLVKDQAKALTISLGVSLIVAFVLAPMLYKILLTWLSKGQIKDDTIFYKWVERGYHRMIDHILRHKPIYFMITLIMMPLGFWIATKLPVRTLPKIEKTESLLRLDWNESIDAAENYSRCQALLAQIKPYLVQYEADIGIKQFILQDAPQAIQEAEVYYACRSEAGKDSADRKVTSWLAQQYPATNWQILDAPNALRNFSHRPADAGSQICPDQ